jgi:hypothetical protein
MSPHHGAVIQVVHSDLVDVIGLPILKTAKIIPNNNHNGILTNLHSFLISTITLSILLFILKPTILLNSTQLLSLSLFYS